MSLPRCRVRLCTKVDLRVSLSNTVPLIEATVLKRQTQPHIEVVSLISISYATSTRATVLFTSLIKYVLQNSVLNVVPSIILCHHDGIPGRSFQDTADTQ